MMYVYVYQLLSICGCPQVVYSRVEIHGTDTKRKLVTYINKCMELSHLLVITMCLATGCAQESGEFQDLQPRSIMEIISKKDKERELN